MWLVSSMYHDALEVYHVIVLFYDWIISHSIAKIGFPIDQLRFSTGCLIWTKLLWTPSEWLCAHLSLIPLAMEEWTYWAWNSWVIGYYHIIFHSGQACGAQFLCLSIMLVNLHPFDYSHHSRYDMALPSGFGLHLLVQCLPLFVCLPSDVYQIFWYLNL